MKPPKPPEFLTVLRKEVLWSRRRVLSLLFVLVLLPGAFAYSSVFFQHVLPRDAPVAVVADAGASADDRAVVTSTLGLFSEPVEYESRPAARRALARERVYAVVGVPTGIADANSSRVNLTVTIDGDVVPYREPSEALVAILQFTLNRNLDARVDVRRETLGAERDLAAYLLPTFLMMLVMTFAFAYLPYVLAREEPVLDRVRVEASLDAAVGGKLAFLGLLLLVPVGVFAAAGAYLGYDARVLAPGALAAYLLTFVALGAVAAAVTFATRFATAGRLLNVLLLFAVFGFSGLVYPAGFFSPLRREVVRWTPTHYAMVVVRGTTLKGHDAGFYAGWLAGLAGFALLGLAALKLALVHYERGT